MSSRSLSFLTFFHLCFCIPGYALSPYEINSTIEKAGVFDDLFWDGSNTTLYLSAEKKETYEGWVKGFYETSANDGNHSQIRKLCLYIKGRPVESLVWKPTGERCTETTLYEGEGQENHWHMNGTRREISRYSNGFANGEYQMWYSDGTLEEKGFYVDGSIHGEVYHYHPDGSPWTKAVFKKGEPFSGQVISWKAKQGKWLITYKEGVKDGPFLSWDEAYRQTMESNFVDGNLSGVTRFIQWHDNGQKMVESHYLDKQMHGRYTQWSDQGNVILEGNYTRGKKQGTWRISPKRNNQFFDLEYIDDELQKRNK